MAASSGFPSLMSRSFMATFPGRCMTVCAWWRVLRGAVVGCCCLLLVPIGESSGARGGVAGPRVCGAHTGDPRRRTWDLASGHTWRMDGRKYQSRYQVLFVFSPVLPEVSKPYLSVERMCSFATWLPASTYANGERDARMCKKLVAAENTASLKEQRDSDHRQIPPAQFHQCTPSLTRALQKR